MVRTLGSEHVGCNFGGKVNGNRDPRVAIPLRLSERKEYARLYLLEGTGESDNAIGKLFGLKNDTVGKIRRRIESTYQNGKSTSSVRLGADGRRIDTANIGKRSRAAAQPDPLRTEIDGVTEKLKTAEARDALDHAYGLAAELSRQGKATPDEVNALQDLYLSRKSETLASLSSANHPPVSASASVRRTSAAT